MENESNNKSVKDTNEKMTRKLTISAILVLFAVGLIIMGVSINSESAHSAHFDLQKICKAEGCSQQKIGGSDYCGMHKCNDEYCKNQAEDGSSYCADCRCCHYLNCTEDRMRDSKFCVNHTCGHAGCREICVKGSSYCVEHQDDENQSFGGSNDSYKNDENQSAGGSDDSYGGGSASKGSIYPAFGCYKNGVKCTCEGSITISDNSVSFSNDSTIYPGKTFKMVYQGDYAHIVYLLYESSNCVGELEYFGSYNTYYTLKCFYNGVELSAIYGDFPSFFEW